MMEVTLEKKSFGVLPAAATDPLRYPLSGVRVSENGVTTATNSYMALEIIPPDVDAEAPCENGVTIPQTGVKKLLKMTATRREISRHPECAEISIRDNPDNPQQVNISGKTPDREYQLSEQTIEGVFPNAKQFIDQAKDNKHFKIEIQAELLMALAKSILLFADGNKHTKPTVTISGTADPAEPIYIESISGTHRMRGVICPIK